MDYMLGKGEVLTLAASDAAGAFRVLQGRIWLTRPGDNRDYLLLPGERFPLGDRGTFVMEALADAVIALEGAAEKDSRSTIRLSLALTRSPLAQAG